ncbi:glycosyltransferase family 1 protein [Variovorax sp. PCZ-1]|uniref:glycosyltransferase family 4 protein n=1 Tax=Variovorax sp. PCZ-1 TaxID=2835533 RepID=UPI001BCF9679|nr:glycosyltransferase family 1 protein [Variovorax sp. PCZ-1]MBS7807672.1 glycosyltransferase family 4 protein [Variovorax sp. PCZ-1]
MVAHGITSTYSGTATRQLLVDISVIYQDDARTGIQRVVRSLLQQLIATPPSGFVVRPVFATRKQAYSYVAPAPLDTPSHLKSQKIDPIKVHKGDVFLGLDLAAHLLPSHQAQLLNWKRNGVQLHIMVYDLLPLQNPAWFNPKTSINFRRWIRWITIYADSAICISESVKAELTSWLCARFGIQATVLPTSTVVLGSDIEASSPSKGLPPDVDFLLARLRNNPTVLMVGTIEPRKAYDQVLAAFEHQWQKSDKALLLVIVGRPGWKTNELQKTLRLHPQAGKRLIWLENASDELLSLLYGACKGVLVASHAEGFGLPLVEASLHNKRILARDIPVFRQTFATGVSYFTSGTSYDLANSIQNWLDQPTITANGSEIRSLPTWQDSAIAVTQAIGLYHDVPGEHVRILRHADTRGGS